jgi:hypothetical protein
VSYGEGLGGTFHAEDAIRRLRHLRRLALVLARSERELVGEAEPEGCGRAAGSYGCCSASASRTWRQNGAGASAIWAVSASLARETFSRGRRPRPRTQSFQCLVRCIVEALLPQGPRAEEASSDTGLVPAFHFIDGNASI